FIGIYSAVSHLNGAANLKFGFFTVVVEFWVLELTTNLIFFLTVMVSAVHQYEEYSSLLKSSPRSRTKKNQPYPTSLDMYSWNIILSGNARLGKMDDGWQLFDEMQMFCCGQQ
ncbi:unnamed protein product, partial [Citrullus colocynthis]